MQKRKNNESRYNKHLKKIKIDIFYLQTYGFRVKNGSTYIETSPNKHLSVISKTKHLYSYN